MQISVFPVQELFNFYSGITTAKVERLDVVMLNGFCANESGMLNANYFLKVVSPDESIHNSALGIDSEIAMAFETEDDAYEFQENLRKMFDIKFYPVLR